jgi:multisubunit Na+/H+ antiporter MnhE subunit
MYTNLIMIILIALFWLVSAGIDGVKMFPTLSAISIYLTYFIISNLRAMPLRLYKAFAIFKYSLWLIKEISISAYSLSKEIWMPNMNCDYRFTVIDSDFDPNSAEIAIYSASIIMTPGTYTINISDESKLLIHSFFSDGAQDLRSGRMQNKIKMLCE